MGGEQLRWNGMECQEMLQQDDQMPGCLVILLMEEILHKLRLVVSPSIWRVVLYIPGGCLGFQPSTVSSTTWQGSCQSVLMPRGYCSFARKPKGRQRQALRGSGFHMFFCTLPETNSSHLKMDGWNTTFLSGWPIFRCHVSFRECRSLLEILGENDPFFFHLRISFLQKMGEFKPHPINSWLLVVDSFVGCIF